MVEDNETVRRRTPWFIRIALIASVLIFTGSLALIYHRYVTTPATDCSVFVLGGKHLDGWKVRVQRVAGDGPTNSAVLTDLLSEKNGYAARFFLPSGSYRIEVWTPGLMYKGGDTAFIESGTRLSLDLNKRFPAPGHEAEAKDDFGATHRVDPMLP